MAGKLKAWLWVSVVLAIVGACMLYPVGPNVANVAFVIVKICMVVGLMVMLCARKMGGFYLWAAGSVGAIVMTCIEWSIAGSPVPLFALSIIVDLGMPIGAWLIMRKNPLSR